MGELDRRRLVIGLALIALVIATAIAVMCVVTWNHPAYAERDLDYYEGPGQQVLQGVDHVYWQGAVLYVHVRRIQWVYRGETALQEFHAAHPPRARWSFGRHSTPARDIERLTPLSIWNRLGFYGFTYDVMFSFTTEHHRAVAVPAWLPALILMVPAVLVLRGRWWIPRRRAKQGRCPRCGYDTRASEGRCPECGHPIPAARGVTDSEV
jgi:hypothetical protein